MKREGGYGVSEASRDVVQYMNTKEIEAKLQQLRRQWKEEPDKRKIIELQAKLLQKALLLKEPQPKLYE